MWLCYKDFTLFITFLIIDMYFYIMFAFCSVFYYITCNFMVQVSKVYYTFP